MFKPPGSCPGGFLFYSLKNFGWIPEGIVFCPAKKLDVVVVFRCAVVDVAL